LSAGPRVHLRTLPAQQQALLSACAKVSARWGAYLAGGTALALRLGHRQSEDLDWFTPETLAPDELLAAVERLGFPVSISQNEVGTFLATLGGVKFSVFRYRYPLVEPLVRLAGAFKGARLAGFKDLAAMKLAAVMGRATKRDYVDVHALLTAVGMPLSVMLDAFRAKYPRADHRPVLRALTYFGDVESQQMPVMHSRTTWKEVKAALVRAVDSESADARPRPNRPRATGDRKLKRR
jgi:hypothetical protein